MRNTFYLLAFAILATALIVLVFLGDDATPIAGLDKDRFADLAKLAAIGLLIGAALMASRHRVNVRLWHVAAWLAILVALMVGYDLAQR